ncbi:hypothetical protein EDB89DRAFT_1902057 [Lactarius sanguifluus]|nr:hypothetical protein EDB89DRAFT_1902057 [Lactarius sanguifluus]
MTTAVATHTTTTPAGRPIDDGSTTTILRQQQGRQVERWHNNNDGPRRRRSTTVTVHDDSDNIPRRQRPTTTTTHDDNHPRRQRPATTKAYDDTDDDHRTGDDTTTLLRDYEYSNYVNEYEYSHSRVLGAQTGTRAASTSITPENSASIRAYEYESRIVREQYSTTLQRAVRKLNLKSCLKSHLHLSIGRIVGSLASPPHLTSIAVSFLGPTREGNQVNIQPHPTSVPPHPACKPLHLKKSTPPLPTVLSGLVTKGTRYRAKRKAYIEQVTVLPPPTMRIRELEQENPNLLRENNKLRHQTTHADKTPISLDGPAL